jgi:integral membrane protein
MAQTLAASAIRQLRIVGVIEGSSFLLLLGVAMPLKYLAGMPQAVRLVGMAHGLLWILYLVAAANAAHSLRWRLSRILVVLAASVLPGGPFFIDGWLRGQEKAASEAAAQGAEAGR